MERSTDANESIHGPGIPGAILIWAILLVLTFLTWFFHVVHVSIPALVIALIIASAKSFLVFTYYMHLKYERPLIRRLVMMTLTILLVVILVIFFDPVFR